MAHCGTPPSLPVLGGCLCGHVRFALSEAPLDAGYCHCRMCQKASGAQTALFIGISRAALTWTANEPRRRRSSPRVERGFCPECGSQISFEPLDQRDMLSLNAGALDDPTWLRPRYHIWCESRMPWFETTDHLPRYAREPGHIQI